MKTRNETEMGYRDRNGIVGQYRGENVCVVAYKDLKLPAKNDTTLYAVRSNDSELLELVQGDMLIGTMTDSGHVELWDKFKRRKYEFYKAPGLDEYKTPVIWEVKHTPVAPATDYSKPLDVEFGYGAYSTIVDNFFKGLDQLWAEIDNSLEV